MKQFRQKTSFGPKKLRLSYVVGFLHLLSYKFVYEVIDFETALSHCLAPILIQNGTEGNRITIL